MARLCPHCDNRSNTNPIFSGAGRWGKEGKAFDVRLSLVACQECNGVIYDVFKRNEFNSFNALPSISFPASVPSVDDYVPVKVGADYISAINCLSIKENKAAAAMFRRSLQQIMIDKNAKDARLQIQIDDLASRGIITNEIKEWSHRIRYLGNDGAHPATDYLDEITDDEIIEVKEFLERVFDYVYIMPGKLQASITSRDNKKNNAP